MRNEMQIQIDELEEMVAPRNKTLFFVIGFIAVAGCMAGGC